MKSVTGIIQARLGSTRLPGKVLLPVLGQPLLAYLAGQLGFCRCLEALILATTTNPADDAIAQCAAKLGLKVYRGSETDVLDRYYQAALANGAQHVMRLTADCPLLQPDVCERAASEYFRLGADYLRTSPRYAEGLDCEIISFKALEQSWREAKLASQREHVTLYCREHPENFKLEEIENPQDDSSYRLTVDEPEDFALITAVIEALHRPGAWISIAEIKAYLATHPEIFNLNNKIVRNQGLEISLASEGRKLEL